jgi:hypothetical protein
MFAASQMDPTQEEAGPQPIRKCVEVEGGVPLGLIQPPAPEVRVG